MNRLRVAMKSSVGSEEHYFMWMAFVDRQTKRQAYVFT